MINPLFDDERYTNAKQMLWITNEPIAEENKSYTCNVLNLGHYDICEINNGLYSVSYTNKIDQTNTFDQYLPLTQAKIVAQSHFKKLIKELYNTVAFHKWILEEQDRTNII